MSDLIGPGIEPQTSGVNSGCWFQILDLIGVILLVELYHLAGQSVTYPVTPSVQIHVSGKNERTLGAFGPEVSPAARPGAGGPRAASSSRSASSAPPKAANGKKGGNRSVYFKFDKNHYIS